MISSTRNSRAYVHNQFTARRQDHDRNHVKPLLDSPGTRLSSNQRGDEVRHPRMHLRTISSRPSAPHKSLPMQRRLANSQSVLGMLPPQSTMSSSHDLGRKMSRITSRRPQSPLPQRKQVESTAIRPVGSRPMMSPAERMRRDATHSHPRDVLSSDSPHRRRSHKTSFMEANGSNSSNRFRQYEPEDGRPAKLHRNIAQEERPKIHRTMEDARSSKHHHRRSTIDDIRGSQVKRDSSNLTRPIKNHRQMDDDRPMKCRRIEDDRTMKPHSSRMEQVPRPRSTRPPEYHQRLHRSEYIS